MISKGKILAFMKAEFDVNESTNNWYRMPDPFDLGHRDHAMAFNMKRLWIRSLRTPYSKNLLEFISEYLQKSRQDTLEYLDQFVGVDFKIAAVIHKPVSTLELPEHFTGLLESKSIMSKRVINYLESRNLDIIELDWEGWGFCWKGEWQGYIIIPFKKAGRLIYYIGRDFLNRDEAYKYKNLEKEKAGIGSKDIFYNEDALNYPKCYLNEGVIDAKTIGGNACASLGWSLSVTQKSKLLNSNCKELIIVADKGFYTQACKLALDFMSYKKIKVLNLDEEDGKDANDLGRDRIQHIESNTSFLTNAMVVDVLYN